MTDEERSRLIAEFEGWKHAFPNRYPDYAHSLDATMRAAQRLPKGWRLDAHSDGEASITDAENLTNNVIYSAGHDPARAAFLCLSDYLASREGK